MLQILFKLLMIRKINLFTLYCCCCQSFKACKEVDSKRSFFWLWLWSHCYKVNAWSL